LICTISSETGLFLSRAFNRGRF